MEPKLLQRREIDTLAEMTECYFHAHAMPNLVKEAIHRKDHG